MLYYVLRALALVVSYIPDRWLVVWARLMAFLLFDIFRIRRRIVLKNLQIAFGHNKLQKERLQIARRSYEHFLLTLLELLKSIRIDPIVHVRLMNRSVVDQALKHHSSLYFLAMHMGNWEINAAAISRLILPTWVVVKDVGSPSVNRFVAHIRRKMGFCFIARGAKGSAYRQILRAQQRGELIGFVMDQARPGDRRLKFFSQEALTNTSLAEIWLKHPYPIIPSIAVRRGFMRHDVWFFPPLNIDAYHQDPNAISKLSQAFNESLEQLICQYPEQYFWLHNRWK